MTFPNPRIHTIPAERMRARCVLACRFISDDCVTDNGGSVTGAPTVSRGATITSGDTLSFNCHTLRDAQKATVFCALSVKEETSTDSISIYLDNDLEVFISLQSGVISAYHDDGVVTSPTLQITSEFADGETHYVSYSLDISAGSHTLYFDSESETGTTTATGTFTQVSISLSGAKEHTLERALIFNDILDSDDIDILKTDNWQDILTSQRFEVWRCNSFGDDTNGNFVRGSDGTHAITKGDGSTSTLFPTFGGDNGEEFYTFDASDYLSLFPTLPTAYTLSRCSSDTTYDGRFPTLEQADTDDSLLDELKTAGSFTYENLHSIYVSNREFKALEKKHLEFQQLRDTWYSSSYGMIRELIIEDVCRAALMFNCPTLRRDITTSRNWVGTNVNSDGVNNYVEFLGTNSKLTLSHSSSDTDFREMTVIIYGLLDPLVGTTRGIMSKGAGIEFSVGASALTFNSSSLTDAVFAEDSEMLAVTAVNGFKPRFFRDELYVGEGTSTVAITSPNSSDFVFGNLNSGTDGFTDAQTKAFLVFDTALTDKEVAAIFYSLRKSFNYEQQPYTVDTWQDTYTSTEIKQDTYTSTNVINDRK